jgi:hypothetical protein
MRKAVEQSRHLDLGKDYFSHRCPALRRKPSSVSGAERTSRGKGARDRAPCGPRDHSFVVGDSIRWGWAGARATPLSTACGSSPGSTGGPGGTLPKLRGPIGTGRAQRLSEVVDCAGSCPNCLSGGPVFGIWTRLTGEHRRSRQAQSCVVDGIFDGIFGVKEAIYQKYRALLCCRGRCRAYHLIPSATAPRSLTSSSARAELPGRRGLRRRRSCRLR